MVRKIFHLKKIIFSFLILGSFLCIAAGEPEVKEYAFFAQSYEEAEKIAAEQGGEFISFCQGIGVLRKRNIANVKLQQGEKSVRLYPDEVFTVEDVETKEGEKIQWHLNTLEMEEVWKTSTGKGITIGVIDSGIDSEHEDLKEGIVYKDTTIPETEYGVGQRFEEAYKGSEDYFGHGTHVAGIIGARANGIGCTGIAPDCNIISIKALEKQGSTGKGKTSWVASAIRLAIEQGADIINLSLGGSSVKNELLYTVIKEAWEKNIPVVCAAGNITGKQTVFYPGAYEETIAVSAVKTSGDSVDFASSFSNYGDWIDISAPGASIMSTVRGGYGTKSGTSMACPVVAGGLALLLEEKKDLSIEEMCNLLYSSAKDLGEKGKDDKYGNGVIDLKQMLQNFKEQYIDLLPVVVFEDNSTIRKGMTINIDAPRAGVKVVYTTDGSIPTAESPVYPEEGIIFSEEIERITINSRCVMKGGSLGKNLTTTYKFIACDSQLEKNGEKEESFPDYGNYIEEETGYPYKRYELTLKAGEKVDFCLAKNDFSGVLALYDSLELKDLVEFGKEQENGDILLKWKNNSNKARKVYFIVKVTDLTKDLGEIVYNINWEVEKAKHKEEGEEQKAESEDKDEGKEDAQNIVTEIIEEETFEKKEDVKEIIKEDSKEIQNNSVTEEEGRKTEIKQSPESYEEDWLYTMEKEDISVEDNGNITEELVINEKKEEHSIDGEEKKKEENDAWKQTKNILLGIVCLGIFLEVFVIIWHIYRKRNDKSQESKKRL